MVLGLGSRSKDKLRLEYELRLCEIKPWQEPVKKFVLHWQRGDRHSGKSKNVTVSQTTTTEGGGGGGKILFSDEAFKLPVTFYREASGARKSGKTGFHEKVVSFSLLEASRLKGTPLAIATLNLAAYGSLEETTPIELPMSVTAAYRGESAPTLLLSLGPYFDIRSKGERLKKSPKRGVGYIDTTDTFFSSPAHSLSSRNSDASFDEHATTSTTTTTRESLMSSLLSDPEEEIAPFTDDEDEYENKTPSLTSPLNGYIKSPSYGDSPLSQGSMGSFKSGNGYSSEFSRLEELNKEQNRLEGSNTERNRLEELSKERNPPRLKPDDKPTTKKQPGEELERESKQNGSKHLEKQSMVAMPMKEVDFSKVLVTEKTETSKTAENEDAMTATNYGKLLNNGSQFGGVGLSNNLNEIKRERTMNESGEGRDNNAKGTVAQTSVLEDARIKFARSMESRNEKIAQRALEEAKQRAAVAEARVREIEDKAMVLESEMEKLNGELLDMAAIEVALYSTVAEHAGSSHKVHSPARRLARLYAYACGNWSQERQARLARNTVSGLVLVTRACGHDIPRLTYWWTNVVVLRETIILQSASNDESEPRQSPGVERSPTTSTFVVALERVESWIYAKVVESIWWQVLTPQMQEFVDQCSQYTVTEYKGKEANARRSTGKVFGLDLCDSKQGNIFLDIWKKAFTNVLERLCPVRGARINCGCLPMLPKLIIEACVTRLDVAMLNAILRGSEEDMPTDPISDPISNLNVLPISTGNLTFGSGAQLKNAIGRLAGCITDLLTSYRASSCDNPSNLVEDETSLLTFPLLQAVGDLLMLPKDMLMDKAVRKEVFPLLNLSLIRRILQRFAPDEFSPEPMSSSLLVAINTEICVERQMRGEKDWSQSRHGGEGEVLLAPRVRYIPLPSHSIQGWVLGGDSPPSGGTHIMLRKDHASDDELDGVELPLFWLSPHQEIDQEDQKPSSPFLKTPPSPVDDPERNQRFRLLREVWIPK